MVDINGYFEMLTKEVQEYYALAGEARKIGIDPVAAVEVPQANSLAERVTGLVSVLYPQILDVRIVARILELEKQFGSLDPAVALVIAEEIAKEKFCKFENHLQAVEAGIRVALGYLTLGYVSSPIEGFIQLKLKKTAKGEDYFAPYYSGPIRSAGGTEAAFSLVIVDHLREIFGYALYDPTQDEVKRGVHECYEYHERITNLQYLPSEQEIEFLIQHMPVQLTGDPSEDREVFNYKDLPRIETNFLRSGFCLVLGEGIAQKAPKILGRVTKLRAKGFRLSGWDWLDDFVKLQKKIKEGKGGGDRGGATYIQDLVAGRPVYAHPSRSGAFRLRYGRSRNTGYSTLALHPATMEITKGSIAIGTQLKIEKPTKGCTVASVDSIGGPIVKLVDGSVRYAESAEVAKALFPKVGEILYLGDLLVPYGDFLNRNHALEKAGYVEQYWLEQLKSKGGDSNLHPSFLEAVSLSKQFGVPLHPDFIYYWKEISYEKFLSLLDWIAHSNIHDDILVLPYSRLEQERFAKGKRALELIGCEQTVATDSVVLSKKDTLALLFNLGIGDFTTLEKSIDLMKPVLVEKGALEIVNTLCSTKICDKGGTFIGARMGRPEKAKLRKLDGSPHVLFPVGAEGGRLRSVQAAVDEGKVTADFPLFYCEQCTEERIFPKCGICGSSCITMEYCPVCDKVTLEKCPDHNSLPFSERVIDISKEYDVALKMAGMRREELPEAIKGVRGTSNKTHSCEHLAKGLLRAKHHVHVNKDGTIRYDMTEMPLTQFRPLEIGTGVEKLRELGYEHDMDGKPLERDDQILELFPHDIILPACPVSPDERADDVFLSVSRFLDDELEHLYKRPRHFNAKKASDLIGTLFGCMSPHTSAVVVGRLIGFSKIQALLASPYIHAAMRRDCFAYDSYFPIKHNGEWEIVKIGEIVEKLNPKKIVDGWGTKETNVKGYATIGYIDGFKQVIVNNFTKHMPLKMLEIKTLLGKKIKVTENHKFIVNGKEKRASSLKIGDELPLPIHIEIPSKKLPKINLLDYLHDEDLMIRGIRKEVEGIEESKLNNILKKLEISKRQFSNFHLRDSYPIKFVRELGCRVVKEISARGKIAAKRDDVEVPIIIPLTRELLEIIGLYVAEGYSRTVGGKKGLNQVYIASSDSSIREFIAKTIYWVFGLKPSEKKNDRVTFSSKVLYLLFTKILRAGSIAKEKRIPSLFLDLNLDDLASVLRGYFEGDGSAERKRKKVSCDSVSEGLLFDLEFCLARFGIFAKRYEYEKKPGPKVREFYIRKNREVPNFKITKLIIGSDFVDAFVQIGFLSERKNGILKAYKKIKGYGMHIKRDKKFIYDPVVSIKDAGENESYCLNVNTNNHLVAGNFIVSEQCDGDEAAVMMLMDLLLNFSRKFLPSHRGGTQDAPLVLNVKIKANEVDDMIFDVDVSTTIPLALYEAGERHAPPGEVKMEQVRNRLGTGQEFTGMGYAYETSDFNQGPLCSSYKTLPTMQDKLDSMMSLCSKIRAVDVSDVSRLVIERHFIRDTRGNLRKFSQQVFRCVVCNEKFRRPPLAGKCTACGGKLLFTISEGSILKYMQPALDLARKYKVSDYLIENLELTEMYIHSIFGKEKEKQMKLF